MRLIVALILLVGLVFAMAPATPHARGTWTSASDLNTARCGHTATLLADGRVLVAAGYGSGGYLTSAELYDVNTGQCTATGDLSVARIRYTATLLSDGRRAGRAFEHRPALGMPYNHAYHDAQIAASGFEKEGESLSGYLSGDYDLPERFYRIVERVKERRGLWVRSFQSKKELLEWVPRVARVLVDAFAEFPDTVPPTEDEIPGFLAWCWPLPAPT